MSDSAEIVSLRDRAIINERVARIEADVKNLHDNFVLHTDVDQQNFDILNDKIDRVETKIDNLASKIESVLIQNAVRQGKEEAFQSIAKSEGGKWGALIGGIVAGAVWAIKAVIGV